MSFIKLPAPEQTSPELHPAYEKIQQEFGFLPNYFRALGREPATVLEQLALAEKIIRQGKLPTAVKEQIGMVVSGINASSYCVATHMELLRNLGVEKPLSRKLATNYEGAPVEEKLKVLFRFADKLTRKPFEVNQADAQKVLDAGWDEDALYETVMAVAYFNYINRVSIGLGLVTDF